MVRMLIITLGSLYSLVKTVLSWVYSDFAIQRFIIDVQTLKCLDLPLIELFKVHSSAFPLLPSSFGEWSHPQYCPTGVLTSFQLRVEPHQGLFGDDTAVSNVKFRCSSNPMLEGPGMTWGEYGHWSNECKDGGICGIETKMEDYQWALDDSSLNDVRFHCCSQQVR